MVLGCALLAVAPQWAIAQGIILPASGAVNRGMGGATTGAAIEAIGSMYWNPATISNLPTNEVAFGFEALYVNYTLDSTFPFVGSGSTEAEIGATPVPSVAWVQRGRDPCVTYGLGIFGVAGYAVNMPADPGNPIVSPPLALGGAGVGGIKTEAIFFQMNPAVSVRVTDRLSVGGGPIIAMGKVAMDDNIFAPLNADFLYPRGDGTRYHWGLGAQLGLHYVHDCNWQFGANLKSPTWFESFRYFSEDAAGLPRTDTVDVTLPLILTTGVAYTGIDGALVTADFRYLNYAATDGLGTPTGYELDGSVTGLGHRDQFAIVTGAQCDLTCRLVGRIGYLYASELIDDDDAFFNVGSDLGYRHIISTGFSYHLNERASISAAYAYAFPWGTTGPYNLPGAGEIPGSEVSTSLDTHALTAGVNVRY
jgi:long-chain fatty acid transport protein